MAFRISFSLIALLVGVVATLVGCTQGSVLQGATIPEARTALPQAPAFIAEATAYPIASPAPIPATIASARGTATLLPALTSAISPSATPTPTMSPEATSAPNPVPPAIPIDAATEVTAAPRLISAIIPEATTENLFLEIIEPAKEAIVRTNTISVTGITAPDALVSVGGDLVDVDKDGEFTTEVTLHEVPNLIEIVASDFQGDTVNAVLTVIYIP